MFGKKHFDKNVEERLMAIKKAQPVKFSTLHQQVLKKAPKVDRGTERKSVYKFGLVQAPNGEETHCVVRDLSQSGAKLVLEGAISLPREFRLVIDGYPAPTHALLKWQNENEAGVTLD